MTFPSHERSGQTMSVDPVGAAAVPICDCIADKKYDKADALLQRVSVKQRKAVRTYIARYFPEWHPATREPDRRPCDHCDEPYVPARSTSRYCSPSCQQKAKRAANLTG